VWDRLIRKAKKLFCETRKPGSRKGVIGRPAVDLLGTFRHFRNRATGLVFLTWEQLREDTGYSYSTISEALDQLEDAGFLRRTRTLVREIIDGVMTVRQGVNLYAFFDPLVEALRKAVESTRASFVSMVVKTLTSRLSLQEKVSHSYRPITPSAENPEKSKKDADLRVFQRKGWQIQRSSLLETGLMRRHLRA
jgi:DNA-binding MarR family transcriptional regulator